MAPRVGQNLGGVRTIADLRARSVIDDETGCWMVRAGKYKGSIQVWYHACGERISLTALMGYLIDGKPTDKGWMYYPTCRRPGCGNPAHRQLGTYSEAWKHMRPTLPALHKARIAASQRAKYGKAPAAPSAFTWRP